MSFETHTHECRDCGRDFDCYTDETDETCNREPICGQDEESFDAYIVRRDGRPEWADVEDESMEYSVDEGRWP